MIYIIILFIIIIILYKFFFKIENLDPDPDQNIILSLTTSPERISKIHNAIYSINLDKINEVHINIPYKYRDKLLYSEKSISDLEKNSKIKIFRIKEDLGPLTKIIPTLQRVNNNDIVISIDDDIKYPRNLVDFYLDLDKNTIYTGKGFIIDELVPIERKKWSYQDVKRPRVDMIEGFSSVFYKKSLMTDAIINDIISMSKLNNDCKYSDDFVISTVLNRHNIPIYTIGIEKYILPLEYGLTYDSLHKGSVDNIISSSGDNNFNRYRKCFLSF